jgi:uncharacterized membrane protein (DUF4010 family)
LVGLFDWLLMKRLLVSFLLVGGAGLAGGWLWSCRSDAAGKHGEKCVADKNPLELSAAFLFALLYVILLAATHYVTLYLGRGGVYGLAALTGLSDITPFVLGLTQSRGTPPMNVAAAAILIAAASNSGNAGGGAASRAGGAGVAATPFLGAGTAGPPRCGAREVRPCGGGCRHLRPCCLAWRQH